MKDKKKQQEQSPKTKKKDEQLSEREWRDLRGEFMQTLHRKNGAWKRR